MKRFPTIKELEDAILYTMGYGMSTCEYHQSDNTFYAVEYVPCIVRDSGGGIDSVEFNPEEHYIPFVQAYRWWEEIQHLEEELRECRNVFPPQPVSQVSAMEDDIELPF